MLLASLPSSDCCTLLSCTSLLDDRALVARALIESPELINWRLTFKAFYGLIALICGNGYIVGINQIYDIGIDKYVELYSCILPYVHKCCSTPYRSCTLRKSKHLHEIFSFDLMLLYKIPLFSHMCFLKALN